MKLIPLQITAILLFVACQAANGEMDYRHRLTGIRMIRMREIPNQVDSDANVAKAASDAVAVAQPAAQSKAAVQPAPVSAAQPASKPAKSAATNAQPGSVAAPAPPGRVIHIIPHGVKPAAAEDSYASIPVDAANSIINPQTSCVVIEGIPESLPSAVTDPDVDGPASVVEPRVESPAAVVPVDPFPTIDEPFENDAIVVPTPVESIGKDPVDPATVIEHKAPDTSDYAALGDAQIYQFLNEAGLGAFGPGVKSLLESLFGKFWDSLKVTPSGEVDISNAFSNDEVDPSSGGRYWLQYVLPIFGKEVKKLPAQVQTKFVDSVKKITKLSQPGNEKCASALYPFIKTCMKLVATAVPNVSSKPYS